VRPKLILLFLLLVIASPSPIRSQDSPHLPGPPPVPGEDSTENENTARIEKAMAKKLDKERHAQLKRDTDKLLQLSTELKQYVDKTNPDIMSVDVIKKSEEIEKLAHSVKEKMKGY
jgi:hypothetical protein